GEPRDLRRGVAGKRQVAGQLEHALVAAERSRQRGGFARGRRVVPELRRSHGPIPRVQAHEPVLLSRHADAADLEPLGAHRIADGGAERVDPPRRVLLARSVVALDQLMRRAADGDDRTGPRVPKDDLGRLRPAVDAEEDPSHPFARRPAQLLTSPAKYRRARAQASLPQVEPTMRPVKSSACTWMPP